jgi:DNA invertase Pin-like site-specific DNA recombinase
MSTRKRLHLFFRPKNALPQFYLHADGRFLLTQMAAVAELEAGLISERTKAALNIARERIATTGQRNHPDVKRTRQSQRLALSTASRLATRKRWPSSGLTPRSARRT